MGWWLLAIVLALALAGGAVWQRVMTRRDEKAFLCPGEMVISCGARLHVRAEGEGQRVVLMSGWGAAAPCVDFQPLASELVRRGFRVMIPEKPGYGFSPDTRVPRRVDTVLDELRGALAQAGEDGPYILMGHSMAGVELLRWACRFPQEVLALYTLDAPAPMCYLSVPTPPLFAAYIQRAQRFFGFKRLSMAIPRFRRGYWKYLNNYRYLDPALLPLEKAMTIKNGGNHATWDEMKRLKENATLAGGSLPEGIPLTMFIASDTREKRWEQLQPEEDAYIARNHARTMVVEGLHNLQHYQPVKMAEVVAADWEARKQ